ncbi:MAG: hypothetical protein IKP28_04660 [Clostridia bacterium]|nr:hypothetical protein [Clostridia bacterium]
MEHEDTKRLNDLLNQLGIKIEDERIVSTLGLYFDDDLYVAHQGLSLERFSRDLLEELYKGEKLSGFHYEEYDRQNSAVTSDFRVLAGRKVSISELMNIAGENIGKYINTDHLDSLKEKNAQLVATFNENGEIASVTMLRENDVVVNSSEEVIEIIERLKKVKEERGVIRPGDALPNTPRQPEQEER